MEKINYKRIIIITFLKVLLMIAVFFTINSWVYIKQSFAGQVPELNLWLSHSLTPSNLVVTALLSIVFYINTLKAHKELAEKGSKS